MLEGGSSDAVKRVRSPFRGGPIIAVGLTTACAIGAITYSHYSQVRDKAEMRAGVERDKERLRLKRKMLKEQQTMQESIGK